MSTTIIRRHFANDIISDEMGVPEGV